MRRKGLRHTVVLPNYKHVLNDPPFSEEPFKLSHLDQANTCTFLSISSSFTGILAVTEQSGPVSSYRCFDNPRPLSAQTVGESNVNAVIVQN